MAGDGGMDKPPGGAAAKKEKRNVVLSHKEDLDGISAAALMVRAHGCDVKLADYEGMMGALKHIAADPTVRRLFVCDLGLSERNQDEFVDIMGRMRKTIPVTYVDHHAIDEDVADRLMRAGITMIHDTRDCASVLVYEAFRDRLDEHASFVAACAAVSDYMEDGPAASRLMRMYDRLFVMLNTTVLAQCVSANQRDKDYLKQLVGELAASRYAHDIPGAFETARVSCEPIPDMIRTVRDGVKRLKYVAYMDMTESGYKRAANYVLGLGALDVGVSYRAKKDHYTVSVRGADTCDVHLGIVVNGVASALGGSGGGHARACGAMIPLQKIDDFVRELDRRIGVETQGGGVLQ